MDPIDSRPKPGIIPASPGAAAYWLQRWRSDGGGITLGRDDSINLWPMPGRDPDPAHAAQLRDDPRLAQAVRIYIRTSGRRWARRAQTK